MVKKVRVYLVDDSAVARLGMRRLLSHDEAIVVVGEASTGEKALAEIPRVEPDVILMDLVMPGLDGLETTRELMARHARPIVLVSELVGRDADLNFKALEAGALDILAKPSSRQIGDPMVARRWTRQVHVLAGVPVITRRRRPAPANGGSKTAGRDAHRRPSEAALVCVGASTGGPPALRRILEALADDPPWPMVIVQHITPGFTGGMARWLGDVTGRQVELVDEAVRIRPRKVYVAPDHRHLELRGQRLVPGDGPPESGHRPSVNVLFESIARTRYAPNTVGVLLTGMGEDGARGLQKLRCAGAWTMAQDEASSVVFGMPKAAADIDAVCEVLPIDGIGVHLAALGGASVD